MTPGRLGALAAVAAGLGYALAVAPVPFYDKGEPREALVVRAVLDGHGVALPRRDGVEMPSKPPLFHWLAALAVRAGVRPEELAMRLPSVVGGAVGVGLTAAVTAARSGATAGVLAAVVLGTSFEWLRAASQSRVDMTLALAVVAATLAWWAGLRTDGGRWLVRLGWIAAAAGVLTKGPVGLVLPLAIAAAGAVAEGEPRRLARLLDPLGLAVAAAIVGAWLLAAWRSGGADFVARQLLHENVRRVAGGGRAPHAHGPHWYGPALLLGFFPWTLALPAAALRLRRRGVPADRFLVAWIVAVFVLYSLAAGKRSVYLLPLFPPLAVLTGTALADWVAQPLGARARAGVRVGAVAVLLVTAVVVSGAADPIVELVGRFLHPSDRANLPLVSSVLDEHRASLVLGLGGLFIALSGLATRFADVRLRAGHLLAVGVFWGLLLVLDGLRPLARAATPRPFAERVRASVAADATLCAAGWVDYAVRYYVARPLLNCPADTRPHFAVRATTRAPAPGCVDTGVADERRFGRGLRFALDACGGAR